MDSSSLKRAIAALALGGATVAFGGTAANVWAQQAPSSSPTPTTRTAPAPGQRGSGTGQQDRHQQLLAAVAAKLNVTPDRLQQAFDQARQELGIPDKPRGGPGHGGFRIGLDAAAQAIGISVDQLRQELPGKSLADVARAHNANPTSVANALKSAANARIDQQVSAGRLTTEQANQRKQELATRIDQQINQQVPANAPQRGGQRSGGSERGTQGFDGGQGRGFQPGGQGI